VEVVMNVGRMKGVAALGAAATTPAFVPGATFATANTNTMSIDLLDGEAPQGGIELGLLGCTSVARGVTHRDAGTGSLR
jgi:hypothetical protein